MSPTTLAQNCTSVSPKDSIQRYAGVVGDIFRLRVLKFFGETLRQAGILILGSTIVIWGLVFIFGLQCGIEGAYFAESVGAPAYAGVVHGLVRPARARPLRVRLHDGREGRHRVSWPRSARCGSPTRSTRSR